MSAVPVSDIPQVEDQFIEEAGTDEALQPRAPSIATRFPIYFAPEIEVDRVRAALVSAGFYLHGDGDGHWCVDQIHALALVQDSANDAQAPGASPMWDHDCPEDGAIQIAVGEACSWCSAIQPQETT